MKKYRIRKNSPIWRLAQFTVFTVLMLTTFATAWGFAYGVQTIKEFFLNLL